MFQLPSVPPCSETSRSPKQRWPCASATVGETCTSCKQIFATEFQVYQESPFEFASMGNNFPIIDKRGFLWTQGDNAHGTFVALFHKKFSVKHTLKDKGFCRLTSTSHASPQAQSIYPAMFLSPWHMNGHCYLSWIQLTSVSTELFITKDQHLALNHWASVCGYWLHSFH